MVNIFPPGNEHELFISWVKERGVCISGVGPAKIEGRGLGLVAQREIKAGEELVRLSASALLTSKSISPGFRNLHKSKGLSIHGLLASFLAFGGDEMLPYAPWQATWPSLADFQGSMPVLWPLKMRDSLPCKRSDGTCTGNVFPMPPAIGARWGTRAVGGKQSPEPGLLDKQEKKMKKDWAIVSKIFPNSTFEEYAYRWCVINTRCFYYELSGTKVQPAREDRMVLCPFIDYFNHADHGCDVAFDETGFTVTSDRSYDVGEEIFTSYGNHNNSFLLVEYGFILETNKWDSLPVDDLLLPVITAPLRHRLETAGYLGNYTLSAEGLCHRTQVAVRTQTLNLRNWKRYVAGLEVTDPDDEAKADAFILSRILKVYQAEAEHALACLEEVEIEQRQRSILVRRWAQIRELVAQVMRNGFEYMEGVKFLDESESGSLSYK